MVSPGLVPGVARSVTYRVQPRDLVNMLFPEAAEFVRKPAVLATGILVALCEWPAMNALRQVMGDDEDSLGMGVSLSHQAPVGVGTVLTLSARCVSVRGRVSRWDVSARDGSRVVASGWAEFAVVRTAEFVARHGVASVGGSVVCGGRQSIQERVVRERVRDGRDLVLACAPVGPATHCG